MSWAHSHVLVPLFMMEILLRTVLGKGWAEIEQASQVLMHLPSPGKPADRQVRVQQVWGENSALTSPPGMAAAGAEA